MKTVKRAFEAFYKTLGTPIPPHKESDSKGCLYRQKKDYNAIREELFQAFKAGWDAKNDV